MGGASRMTKRVLRVMFNKVSKDRPNATSARITLPKPFVNALGITPEQPEVEMVLDGDQIIIKKKA